MSFTVDPYSFSNLLVPKNIRSGVAEQVLLAPVAWFDVNGIKAPVAPFTNQGDSITITTPHVFLTGKAFVKMQLAPQKNKLSLTTVGDLGLSRQNGEIEVFVAGSYAEVHEQMQAFLNQPLISLIKDADCAANLWYQFGSDCTFTWLTFDFTTGTTKDGVKGFTAKLSYDGSLQIYNVTGGPTTL
jgi:hypothetical protein